ncbi:RHS repeat domain-containing protein, partial [uncultured Treponema sp.]|uniref:RHS repeat domain-containing protein n=1 Tax=uncultured Treponema sp. TaxID=162155 RepID=UPI0034D97D8C
MKTKFCFYSQLNYPHPRTAIEAEILFAARIKHLRFLKRLSGKTPREQSNSGKKIEAESAVPILVYFYIVIMVHKYRQSAKRIRSNKNILLEVFPLTAGIAGSGKTKPFEKRRSRYKETAENKAEAYRVYVEHLFSACDAVDARIFSKGDGIDRVIKTLLPDGSEQKNEYAIEDGLQVTKATDPLENKSVTKKDARGNIREVERRDKADNILTKGRYEYSVLGEMLRAYDANENIVSVTYDLLGRRVALESKDTGRKEWRYDSKGLLEAESDSLLRSKLSEIQYHYDSFDRIVKIDYPFSTDVEYTYGQAGQAGAGEIVHKKDESGEIRYEYGKLSEVVKETRTIKRYEPLSKPETAIFTYRCDYLGRMQTMRYPDGETITYTYDKGGQLKGVSGVKNTVKGTETYSYIDTIVYDEHGQRVYIKYGNGVETKYRYDDKRRWLKDIETKNRQTDEIFQKIRYSFDKVGNVLGYSNDASVYETSQSYTYDGLYQLIGVEGTSNQYKAIKSFGSTPVNVAKYKQDFAFDGIGNMTKKSSTTNLPGARGNAYPKAELDYALDYEYDPSYAHRLVHAGNRYYRYDANGNITAEKDGPFTEDDEFIFTYSYDPETDVYGTDYGFGLDAPKETEESHPENLFAYRRNYTWNEKNLLTKSSDRSYTVHYRYGEDGQRALKYTEEGRSETLYFNNFYTIHIPVQDKNNPQGLRVHK